MLSTSIEDYIKAIYELEAEHRKATTKRIAASLDVKMASVTGMIKHLAAEGFLQHTPYHGVHLTEKGRNVAVKMIRCHRIIELFLCRTLSLTWDEVDADAEVLEHAISDKLIERIYEYLGRPQFDPHGSPIPAKNGSLPPPRGLPLSDLPEGTRGSIVEVSDQDPEFLRYLTKLQLGIGTQVCVGPREPFGGPVTLRRGAETISLGPDAARRIHVRIRRRPKRSKKSGR